MDTRGTKIDRGFTLIELLVVIAIIAILITLVAVGVGRVHSTAKGAAERQTVVTLNQAVQAFKQEFGFLPPLITHNDSVRPVEFDTAANPAVAVPNAYGGRVAAGSRSFNGNTTFLEGFQGSTPNLDGAASTKIMSSDWGFKSDGATQTDPDSRYSEYSLAYYLVGALPRGVDGVDGPGMFRPKTDGTFDSGTKSMSSRVNDSSGRIYPPFVDTSRRAPKLEEDITTEQSKDSNLKWTDPDNGKSISVNARFRLMSPNGKPYRYYRWSPRLKHTAAISNYFDPVTGKFTRAENDIDRLNVPSMVGDPLTDSNLRSAEYAIVSAGPNGFFGDMPSEGATENDFLSMASALKVSPNPADWTGSSITVRKAARADNVVEVGR